MWFTHRAFLQNITSIYCPTHLANDYYLAWYRQTSQINFDSVGTYICGGEI